MEDRLNAATNQQYQALKDLKSQKSNVDQQMTITTPRIPLQQLFRLYARQMSGDFLDQGKRMDTIAPVMTEDCDIEQMKQNI